MKEIRPHPSLLTLWRAMAAAGALLPAFLAAVLFRAGSAPWLIANGVWLALFLALYLIYLPLLHRRLSYTVGDGRVTKRGGVFYYSARSLPVAGIQYIILIRTPLDRLFRLNTVILAVAGGRVLLPGLTGADADLLSALPGGGL